MGRSSSSQPTALPDALFLCLHSPARQTRGRAGQVKCVNKSTFDRSSAHPQRPPLHCAHWYPFCSYYASTAVMYSIYYSTLVYSNWTVPESPYLRFGIFPLPVELCQADLGNIHRGLLSSRGNWCSSAASQPHILLNTVVSMGNTSRTCPGSCVHCVQGSVGNRTLALCRYGSWMVSCPISTRQGASGSPARSPRFSISFPVWLERFCADPASSVQHFLYQSTLKSRYGSLGHRLSALAATPRRGLARAFHITALFHHLIVLAYTHVHTHTVYRSCHLLRLDLCHRRCLVRQQKFIYFAQALGTLACLRGISFSGFDTSAV
ncbi:hypothetical protein VTK56DRAFT_672 [Thermocarpiscus australiensis]